MKIGPGVLELCGGSKIALCHWQGLWLYNSLYYRTSLDSARSLNAANALFRPYTFTLLGRL